MLKSTCLGVLVSIAVLKLISAYNDPGAFDFAAFNVQVFGRTKMSNPVVRENLKRIILRYDMILIQEIRDSSGEAIQELLTLVNEERSAEQTYALTLSERLGRTSSKEQYAFLYRTDWVQVVQTYQYADPNDVFEREPFGVKIHSSRASAGTFGIIAIHTAPDDAENEISELAAVYDDVKTVFSTENIIITGDFNAGCNYVDDWSQIRLATDPRFYWLIDNSKDTTTKKTDCPYDRIVVAGNQLITAVLPLSPNVLYFDEMYQLDSETTLDISDHYPVAMQIQTANDAQSSVESAGMSVHENNALINKNSIRQGSDRAEEIMGYSQKRLFTSTGGQALIEISKSITGTDNLITEFTSILENLSDIMSLQQIEDANRWVIYESPYNFLPYGHGKFKTLRDFYSKDNLEHNLAITCDMTVSSTKGKCTLRLTSNFK